jgi:hypothetical protein
MEEEELSVFSSDHNIMISSPRRNRPAAGAHAPSLASPSVQQQQQQQHHDSADAPLLLVPTTARDLTRSVAQSRRYAAFQLLAPLSLLASASFLALAATGYLGNGSLQYYLTVLYATKLTPAWWTFWALPAALLLDFVALCWFALPWPHTELLFRRRWSRTVIPSFTVAFVCEIGWLFALLYDLAWLALVFAFLASIALFAAWFASVRMTKRHSRQQHELDLGDSDDDPDLDADADAYHSARQRGAYGLASAVADDNEHPSEQQHVASALLSAHSGGGGGGDADDDLRRLSDSGDSLRRPTSSMMTASSAGDASESSSMMLMSGGFITTRQAAARRAVFQHALWQRAWPLARLPSAVHFGVALLRVVLNMQIVAVNQFVIVPQSVVYEAIVVTGLTMFTACVLCFAAWQRDVLVAAICCLGLASVAFGPRSCFNSATCTDKDSVLISLSSASLAGVLAVLVFVLLALRICRGNGDRSA